MDKIRDKVHTILTANRSDACLPQTWEEVNNIVAFIRDIELSTPQLTETCPDCGGAGGFQYSDNPEDAYGCPTCQGTGKVNRYYTPEEYEELTGKKMLDSDPVWMRCLENEYNSETCWILVPYCGTIDVEQGDSDLTVVAFPGQEPPPVDYKVKR